MKNKANKKNTPSHNLESGIERNPLSKEERKKAALKAAGSAKHWTPQDYREIQRLANHEDWD